MLSFLLDENISPEIGKQISEKRPEIPVSSVYHWHGGKFQAQRDEAILLAAASEGLTLITYDQKTIVSILVQWGQAKSDHAGVIFVDDRSIASSDFGRLSRALMAVWDASYEDDWTNRVEFLKAKP